MIWVSLVFVVGVLTQWWRDRKHLTWGEVTVGGVMLTITLAFSAAVTWHLWPEVQPLRYVEMVFEPPTRWMYRLL